MPVQVSRKGPGLIAVLCGFLGKCRPRSRSQLDPLVACACPREFALCCGLLNSMESAGPDLALAWSLSGMRSPHAVRLARFSVRPGCGECIPRADRYFFVWSVHDLPNVGQGCVEAYAREIRPGWIFLREMGFSA